MGALVQRVAALPVGHPISTFWKESQGFHLVVIQKGSLTVTK